MVTGKRPKARKESSRSGLAPDKETQQQDTPGKPKSASSRQQTQPEQAAQTGSQELDTPKRR